MSFEIYKLYHNLRMKYISYVNYDKVCKGHDPNPWFSGITFSSGLALWSFQIKKWSLMGCLFFDADFSTFFHFGR